MRKIFSIYNPYNLQFLLYTNKMIKYNIIDKWTDHVVDISGDYLKKSKIFSVLNPKS